MLLLLLLLPLLLLLLLLLLPLLACLPHDTGWLFYFGTGWQLAHALACARSKAGEMLPQHRSK